MDNHLHFLLNSNIRVDLETGPRTYTSVPMSAISSDRQFSHTCHAVIEKIMNYLRLTEILFTSHYFRSKNPSILQPIEIPFP